MKTCESSEERNCYKYSKSLHTSKMFKHIFIHSYINDIVKSESSESQILSYFSFHLGSYCRRFRLETV